MRGALHTQRYRRFLDRLKEARLEAGLTQSEAAAKLRKPQSFISKSEAGDRRVDVIELEDFAKAYGRPISFFIRQ